MYLAALSIFFPFFTSYNESFSSSYEKIVIFYRILDGLKSQNATSIKESQTDTPV